MAQAAANQQNPGHVPRSPTRTAISQRRPHPAYDPVATDHPSNPVIRHKHRGRPPIPPSPPVSGSSPNTDPSSSDSSSSSRARSPRGKKAKDKVKFKEKETRSCPSPFSAKTPKSLETPPPMTMYTGRSDPDEHVDTFDLLLDYSDASDNVRCKLFPLSLSKLALKWYRELPSGSITSWAQFTKLLSPRFTASRVKPKSADMI